MSSETNTTGPGITYICTSKIADNNYHYIICHYNGGDWESHKEAPSFDYYGYVHDPSDPLPDYKTPWLVYDGTTFHSIAGLFCEVFLQPVAERQNPNPYTMFVRIMIDPRAGNLEKACGYPVGWAVRGYLPEELARRNHNWQMKGLSTPWKNDMKILPVFCADEADLAAVIPNCIAGMGKLQRVFYITNQPDHECLWPWPKDLPAEVSKAKAQAKEEDEAKANGPHPQDNPKAITTVDPILPPAPDNKAAEATGQ